jgi:general stress protein 26
MSTSHDHSLDDSSATANDHAKLWELIKDTRFGMFVHRHHDGLLNSHPLTTQNRSVDEGGTLYFFVPKDGEIARLIAEDDVVNVAYANTDKDSYVSVAGHASLLDDQAKKEELFNTAAKAWFPNGPTDPNLGLLTVRIANAEYWDVDDSKMVQLFKMAKAAITGEQPKHLGEHKKLDIS